MNIINKGILKLALLPKGAYQRMGINFAQLQAILVAKLTMDDRRPNTLMQMQQQQKDKPVSAATIGAMIISAVMGLFFLFVFALGDNPVFQLTFYFSIFFFMLSSMLIADFTAVLIDVRDNYIILPKPVGDRTVVAARLLHIFIHISKLVIPMCAAALVYLIYNNGAWAGITFLLMVLLTTLFSIFFINAVYILILKITSPEKFKTIINYVQVFLAIAIFASYQILPRMMGNLENLNVDLSASASSLALPFYWFASGWYLLTHFGGNSIEWTGTALALLLPPLCIWVVVKYLAPAFNRKLAGINSVAAENKVAKTVAQKSSYAKCWSRLLTGKGGEEMGFLFTWKMTGRSRDFQLRVYPAIGYMLVFVVLMFMGRNKSLGELAEGGAGRGVLLSAIYITSFLLIAAMQQLNVSEKHKASWLYLIAPVQAPGHIITGAIKAIITKFYLPVALVIIIAGLLLAGLPSLPNLVLGLLNIVLVTFFMAYINKRHLPFSTQENTSNKGANFIKGILIMISIGIVSLLHYLVYYMLPVVCILILLSAAACWLLMGSIKKTTWAQIQQV